ncbi:MAG TPA: GTPase HflX [Candidatus Dormibacteraeota bacterium]|jgi:GTP-binding protein HflX|nr:GTPase HflX [Candidatus Dormibacteraeota bacterium]
MSTPTEAPQSRAVLVGVQLAGVTDAEQRSSLTELKRLCETLGFEVVGEVTQKRQGLGAATLLGEGKLAELAGWTGGTGVVRKGPPGKRKATEETESSGREKPPLGAGEPRATVVVIDHDLSPRQLRHIEGATSAAAVLDRTGLIIEIFHRHASSRPARLQVEIARLTYVAPRLRETGGGERQRGGIGQRGAGESSIELDRRKIRDRISELKAELAAIDDESKTRRAKRQEALRVALVGYTNAGKSSLMRALTGSHVLVADKLFATLDTTVRALWPESRPRILVSDTVGFIKKLPHDLVASFRSTLDEALEASLLLQVVDAADPGFRAQMQVTREVLDEIGAGDVPWILVLNKIDKVAPAGREELSKEFPAALLVSAKDPADVGRVRDAIIGTFEADMTEVDLVVPYDAGRAIGEIHKLHVISESYEGDGVHYRLRAPGPALERLRAILR